MTKGCGPFESEEIAQTEGKPELVGTAGVMASMNVGTVEVEPVDAGAVRPTMSGPSAIGALCL